MSEAPTSPEPGSRLGVAALIFLSAGWVVAVLLGDGFELHRSALAMPFVVIGAGCGLVEALRSGRVIWLPALVAGGVAMLYLAARAMLSPVWDLGRHDLHLVALAWLTIATVASCGGGAKRAALLIAVITLVFLAHLVAGLYQRFGDPAWVLLRLPRSTSGGVSGLFWHWNNLAAFLAIALPVFLGIALCVRRLGWRSFFFALVGAGLVLAYFSKSRAGLAAVVIGLGATGVVLLLWRSRSWSWSARLGVFASVALAGIAAAVVLFMVASRVSEQRGHGADLGRALGKSSRLALAGMAFDQWMAAPLLGQGSQSYLYLATRNWDDETLPVWLENPETVHNEYLQILADYGLVGFLLVMSFLLVVLARVVMPSGEEEDRPPPLVRGLQLGAAGGLVATMVHATVEFQLHLLPILLLVAIAIGALLGSGRPAPLPTRWVHALTVVLAMVLAMVSVGRENLAAGKWLGWQRDVIRSGGKLEPAKLDDMKALVEASPHYKVAMRYGQLRYDQYLRAAEAERKELLEEAIRGLARAYRRNPFDQTTLVSYAIALDQARRHEEATVVHLRAVEMAGRRENKYGAMAGLAMNLYYRGEELFMARKTEEAFSFFLRAMEYLEASKARGFKFGGSGDYRQRRRLLESRISLLQSASIAAKPLRGVPPPPEED